ncbi:tetratricopeptide repeat protein [Streptomyces sp. Tu 2975]|uniref:transglutaminase-like domain-containing protein n=1 Tax=Streptomyces sp. Tu 2975 TaxID=2676871 RepID=UPI00135B65C3|nr:transglutaminase-like domain-containing protein [Streptomyces sp. Tu 2975]QIP84818.1 tetratricopeptide repeat protein [Streptomyces sp. Tu 2975]
MHQNDRRSRFAQEARSQRPDVALLCLLIGAEADPSLDEAGMDAAQIELDRLAGMLPYGLRDPHAWAAAVADLLGGREGFHGTAGDYQHLESSLLHEVLHRRRGLPILLSVVWTEVARRAGAHVHGVALPGHFVVGFGDPEDPAGQVLADPFAAGRVLSGTEADLLVTSTVGTSLTPSMLTPADPLAVISRILNNIRAWAAQRPEHSAVALWALELLLLLPSHPARLRFERAQLLVQRGDFLTGAAEMDAYAEVVDAVEPTAAEEIRGRARAARAMLN